MKRADVPVVLARHGIDPDADADALVAALAGRGWAVTREEEETAPRQRPRWRALATRPRAFADPRRYRSADHVRGRGRTEVEALAGALAAALVVDVIGDEG